MLMSKNVNNDITMNPNTSPNSFRCRELTSIVEDQKGKQRMQLRREKGKQLIQPAFLR